MRRASVALARALNSDAVRLFHESSLDDLLAWAKAVRNDAG
jgi:hypothetical protein